MRQRGQEPGHRTGPGGEDRGYLPFMAAAIGLAVAGGFLLAVYVPLAGAGRFGAPGDVPFLIQAHGALQLQGGAGLFVVGIGFRLAPRLTGRPPVPSGVSWAVVSLLVAGTVLRAAGQSLQPLAALMRVGFALWALGSAGAAATWFTYLVRSRHFGAWWLGIAAGALWGMWWAAWMALLAVEVEDRFLPYARNEPLLWGGMFGAIGNFIWAVQSRAVPNFFGRQPVPWPHFLPFWAAYNAGLALVVLQATAPLEHPWLQGVGLTSLGLGLGGLVFLVAALRPDAHRLRPRARPSARYIAAANWLALLAAALLAASGVDALLSGEVVPLWLRDAARHSFALGPITMLIIGMAQLITPIFALGRAEVRRPGILDRASPWVLLVAALLRVGASLSEPLLSYAVRMDMAAGSGVLAWLGVASFGWRALQARLNEGRMLELLAQGAR